MITGTGSGIIAPGPGTVQTVYNAPSNLSPVSQPNPNQVTQPVNTALALALNPCGPISLPGGPGTSSPPLWVVPPGNTFIDNSTVDNSSSVTGAGGGGGSGGANPATDGVSLNDLYNVRIPWWIFAVVILILLLAADKRQ